MNAETILLRQAHPNFVENGEVSRLAFHPFPKDSGLLSVDDGDLTTAAAAHSHYTEQLKLESAGTWGVSCAEVTATGLTSRPDPIAEDLKNKVPANPAHAVIDFGQLSDKECRKLAKRLKVYANARKCLHAAA